MPLSAPVTFGELLKQLRKRGGMTQAELARAVGYSASFISNLEQNQRLPDVQVIGQRFVPVLGIQERPQLAARLVDLATAARGECAPAEVGLQQATPPLLVEEREAQTRSWPAPPTALVGREQEVNAICNYLLGHSGRLLTLVGPPGIGKTRLGLAVIDKLQAVYADGVYFVPLAAISNAQLLASTLVSALGINELNKRTPKANLLDFLRGKDVLLLLDNFEQITAAAPLVAELLAECPGLCLLVTSRERLHLRAEQRYRVPPLELASAVSLFVQRAQAAEADFALSPDIQSTVTKICQHLDCLPLAIELCAAQADLLTPQALLARLRDHRLDLLIDGPLDLPVHQRTLRNTIHRSYELLNERECTLFRTLGVFVSGFGQEACENLGMDEMTLQALIHKSLVQVTVPNHERNGGARRFLLLETLREYAWEQLCAQGESAAIQRLHAESYLQLAEEAESHLRGSDQAVWLDRLALEYGNLRAALAWAVASQQTVIGARLGIALWRFWYVRGHYEEGWHWLQKLLLRADQPEQRASLLYAQGRLATRRGDFAAGAESFAVGLALFRKLGDSHGIASALRGLGFIRYLQDQHMAARSLFEEALAVFRRLNDREGIAVTLDNLAYMVNDRAEEQRLFEESLALRRRAGNLRGISSSLSGLAHVALDQADYAAACVYAQEYRQISEELGNQNGVVNALNLLGLIAYAEGDYTGAQLLYEKGLALCEETGDRLQLSGAILNMGTTATKLGEYDRAHALFEQALVLDQEMGVASGIGQVLEHFAYLAVAQEQAERSVCLAGAAAALYESLPDPPHHLRQAEFARDQACARQLLGEEATAAAWATGRAMTLEQAVAYALAKPLT